MNIILFWLQNLWSQLIQVLIQTCAIALGGTVALNSQRIWRWVVNEVRNHFPLFLNMVAYLDQPDRNHRNDLSGSAQTTWIYIGKPLSSQEHFHLEKHRYDKLALINTQPGYSRFVFHSRRRLWSRKAYILSATTALMRPGSGIWMTADCAYYANSDPLAKKVAALGNWSHEGCQPDS